MSTQVLAEVRPSPIHGVGLFALQDVKSGTVVVWECGRCLVVPEDVLERNMFHAEAAQVRRWGYLRSPGVWLLPCDHARYVNHSDAPNLKTGRFGDYAARDIAAGEELTVDYRAFDLAWREKLCR